MEHKKLLRTLIVVSVIGIIVGAVIEGWLEATGQFLELFSFVALAILIVLYFLSEQIFTSWIKFTKFYLPISIILTLISPSNRQCGLGVVCLGSDKEDAIFSLGVLFMIISLILIVRAQRRVKREQRQAP